MAITQENTFDLAGMLDQDPSTGFFGLGSEGGLFGLGLGSTQGQGQGLGSAITGVQQERNQPAGQYDNLLQDPRMRDLANRATEAYNINTEPTRLNLFDMINQQTRGMSEQIETNLNVRGLRGGGSQGLSALSGLRTAELGAKANVLTGLTQQQTQADIELQKYLGELLSGDIGIQNREQFQEMFAKLTEQTQQEQTLDPFRTAADVFLSGAPRARSVLGLFGV